MSKQHHIVYIPGLGDQNPRAQIFVVRLWRVYRVYGHCFPLHWADGEAFEPKFDRLLEYIDELLARGYTVSLVGSSAGASATLRAYAARRSKIAGAVLICGKIARPEAILPHYFTENPAFKASVEGLQTIIQSLSAEDRRRILSLYPLYDGIVPIADTYVEDATMRRVPSIGHSVTIAAMLTIGASVPIRFLRRQARQMAQEYGRVD